MRKFCLKIHRWFALPLGVIMAILCFSGLAILLIKDLAPLFDMNAKELPILYNNRTTAPLAVLYETRECT